MVWRVELSATMLTVAAFAAEMQAAKAAAVTRAKNLDERRVDFIAFSQSALDRKDLVVFP